MYYIVHFSILFLSLFSCFSQTKSENIEYLFDKNEIFNSTTIVSSNSFNVLEKDLNNGLQKGIYWFKIPAQKVSVKKLSIANSHILKAKVYLKANKTLLLPLKNEAYLTFNIPEVVNPIYLKVEVERAAYIPIRIETEEAFVNGKFKAKFINGLYYGFTLMIFFLNLLYFFKFKEVTFYYYLFALISITISIAFTDGTFNGFGHNAFLFKKGDMLNQYFMAISGYYFASSYLELDFHMPKNKFISILLLLLLIPLVVSYLISDQFIFYVISKAIVYGLLGMYLLCGFLLYRKSKFAKFFCLAYSIIFFLGLMKFIGRDIGFNIKPMAIKIGGAIEMLLISYAIFYRMNVLKKENELMKQAVFDYIKKINNLKTLKTERKEKIIEINENDFSKQELQILKAIGEGLSNKEIANKMFISVNTVKYHTKKLYRKLEVDSRKKIHKNNTIYLNRIE